MLHVSFREYAEYVRAKAPQINQLAGFIGCCMRSRHPNMIVLLQNPFGRTHLLLFLSEPCCQA